MKVNFAKLNITIHPDTERLDYLALSTKALLESGIIHENKVTLSHFNLIMQVTPLLWCE